MGLFDLFKKKSLSKRYADSSSIPEEEFKYYKPDEYYTFAPYPDSTIGAPVVTFEERKKTCIPSEHGLYVAEILLLDYCAKGKYPNPKNGYPGFWWIKYGISDVGGALRSLEKRGFIYLDKSTEKYKLTDIGKAELQENGYVPYMHKNKNTTAEDSTFGKTFNVWSINRLLGKGDKSNWQAVLEKEEKRLFISRETKKQDPFQKKIEERLYREDENFRSMTDHLTYQNALLSRVNAAREKYNDDGDLESVIKEFEYAFWKADPPCESAQYIDLVGFYLKAGMNDRAWAYLNYLISSQQAPMEKIRFEQARILKKEKRYADAIEMYMLGHLAKSKLDSIFHKDKFIKDIQSSANKLGLDENQREYLANLVESTVKRKNYDENALLKQYRKFICDI